MPNVIQFYVHDSLSFWGEHPRAPWRYGEATEFDQGLF